MCFVVGLSAACVMVVQHIFLLPLDEKNVVFVRNLHMVSAKVLFLLLVVFWLPVGAVTSGKYCESDDRYNMITSYILWLVRCDDKPSATWTTMTPRGSWRTCPGEEVSAF